MSLEIAWKQNILVTDSNLLKLLLVVFGFGSQAFICEFSRQNICSVEQKNKSNSERISSYCNARLKMQKSLTNDCLYHQWHSAIQYIIITNFDRSTKKNWYWQLEKEQTFQPFWQKPLKRHVNYLLVFKPPKSWIHISFWKLFLWS